MSEVKTLPMDFGAIGTDNFVLGPASGRYESRSLNLYAQTEDKFTQPQTGPWWEPKDRSAETTGIYDGDVAGTKKAICMPNIEYNVKDIIGCELGIASSDGQKLYNLINGSLRNGFGASLSFDEMTILSYAFLNSAIGQLYNGDFPEEYIRQKLTMMGLSSDYEFLLSRIIIRAEEYYKNPVQYNRNLGDDNAY